MILLKLVLCLSELAICLADCTIPPVAFPVLYLETAPSVCQMVNGTFKVGTGSGIIFSNTGPICAGPSGSDAKWLAPTGAIVPANRNSNDVYNCCGVYSPESNQITNISNLRSATNVCLRVVFTCVITEADNSITELYVAYFDSPWTATAAISVTLSTVPQAFVLNCTTSALAVTWALNGSRAMGDARSKLLSAQDNILVSHTLTVTTASFGIYTCTVDPTFGGATANIQISRSDIVPVAPDVFIEKVGLTYAVLQLNHSSQSPPTLFYNITYSGGCNAASKTLRTAVNTSTINVTGLSEGSVYSFAIYSQGIFQLPSSQASIRMVQTLPGAPSTWPLELRGMVSNTTHIILSWLEPSCETWKGLNRSYTVLYSSGDGSNMTITSNTPNVTIGNLKSSTLYWFRVAAVNENATGPYSPAINITLAVPSASSSPLTTVIVPSVVGVACVLFGSVIFIILATLVYRCHAKKIDRQDIELSVLSNPCVENGSPPVIEQFPDSCLSSEEGFVTMEGKVTGYPPPTCQWRYNGVNLNLTNNGLQHMREGGKLTLPVIESGVYQFVATNHLGSTSVSVKVTLAHDSDQEEDDSDRSNLGSPSISSEKSVSMKREKPVPVNQLKDYVVRLQANFNDGFHCQYKCLPSGAGKEAKAGLLPENRRLNRLPKIVPYDDNRVVLHPMYSSNDTCNEYINASYIYGHDCNKKFIATQGPLQCTLVDFWWMVWQEGTSVIVMLCDLVERGKVLCQQYWPDDGGVTYGPFLITLMGKQETHPHYIIHNIQLQMLGSSSKQARQIRHYKFTSWPEHGVLENAGPLLALRQRVMEDQNKAPIIVHCNGAGRTGVFIALDCALEQAKSDGCVDVMAIVTHLREQRMKLVQTEAQYIFIYNSLLEELACECSRIPVRDLRSYLSKHAESIEAQYDLLLKITPKPVDDVDRTTALSNVDLNRSTLFLPWEKQRVVLQGIKPDYIHASYVDGYETKRAFIVAEGPMKNTCDRFWHMVFQEQCSLILMLSALKEYGTEICHKYWPSEGESYFQGLTVKLEQQTKTESHHERRFTVFQTQDPNRKLKVTHIQVLNWMADGQCANYDVLVRTVEKIGKSTVVHCSDTVSRSGMLIALSNVVQQAKMEGIVDVFQAVKRLRIQKPGAVQSLSQYQLIYELVRHYLTVFDNYNN